MIVANLVRGVTAKLGNRTDLTTTQSDGSVDLYRWIGEAVTELTDNYSFEQLHVKGPVVQVVQGQQEYSKYWWSNGGEGWTDVLSFWLYLNSNSGPGWMLQYRDTAVVDALSNVANGPPTLWAQHGDNIILGLTPDQNYYTYWKYQRRHPFTYPVNVNDKIYMPEVWQEVVEYAAALRGALEKRATDWIQLYDTILNGDEQYHRTGGKVGRPGLIFGRVSQEQRNKQRNSRQLAPMVVRYGAR